MSRTYSAIPEGGKHAVHLRSAIKAFKDVPGSIGLFWKPNKGDAMAASALDDVANSLTGLLLSPPNKAELSEEIAKIAGEPRQVEHETFAEMLMEQRRQTLRGVYDPTVYNLDAAACRGCGQGRMGHCDISRSDGQHCTNCILWRPDNCVCNPDDAPPLIEWLIIEAEQARNNKEKSNVLAQPKNLDNLAPNKKKKHTIEFCRKMFGPSFVWPQGHPPSPAMPEQYCQNVLGLAGQQERDNVTARFQAIRDKRQTKKAKYGSRDETDNGGSAAPASSAADSDKSKSKKTKMTAMSARAEELAAKKLRAGIVEEEE